MSSDTADDHKCSPGFDDPTADMVIETTDKKRFRVHSHTLRTRRSVRDKTKLCYCMLKFSAYFRSMPEHMRELSGHSEKVVHLDVDSNRLAKLLSFLDSGPQARAQLNWPSLKAITETGNIYRFDTIPDLVARAAVSLLRLRRCSPLDPFSIFKFAAQHDYCDLAKFAVSFFAITEFHEVGHLSQVICECFDDVPGRYVAAFFRAMAISSDGDDWDWRLISSEFRVKDKED